MQINIIAAVAKNRAIGYQNDMVYYIKRISADSKS